VISWTPEWPALCLTFPQDGGRSSLRRGAGAIQEVRPPFNGSTTAQTLWLGVPSNRDWHSVCLNHRWAADPGTTITTAMIDALRSSRLFSLVVPYVGREQQEYVLSGRVERLDEVDYGGGVRAQARILAELVNQRTGETLRTGDASETSNIETRTVGSVVDAMSHAIATSIDRLVASMELQPSRP
jgi:hypothetical protein